MSSLFEFKDNKIIYKNNGYEYIATVNDNIHYNLIQDTLHDINNIIFYDNDKLDTDNKNIHFKVIVGKKEEIIKCVFICQSKIEIFEKELSKFKRIIINKSKLPFTLDDDFYINIYDDYKQRNIIYEIKKLNIELTVDKYNIYNDMNQWNIKIYVKDNSNSYNKNITFIILSFTDKNKIISPVKIRNLEFKITQDSIIITYPIV